MEKRGGPFETAAPLPRGDRRLPGEIPFRLSSGEDAEDSGCCCWAAEDGKEEAASDATRMPARDSIRWALLTSFSASSAEDPSAAASSLCCAASSPCGIAYSEFCNGNYGGGEEGIGRWADKETASVYTTARRLKGLVAAYQ